MLEGQDDVLLHRHVQQGLPQGSDGFNSLHERLLLHGRTKPLLLLHGASQRRERLDIDSAED